MLMMMDESSFIVDAASAMLAVASSSSAPQSSSSQQSQQSHQQQQQQHRIGPYQYQNHVISSSQQANSSSSAAAAAATAFPPQPHSQIPRNQNQQNGHIDIDEDIDGGEEEADEEIIAEEVEDCCGEDSGSNSGSSSGYEERQQHQHQHRQQHQQQQILSTSMGYMYQQPGSGGASMATMMQHQHHHPFIPSISSHIYSNMSNNNFQPFQHMVAASAAAAASLPGAFPPKFDSASEQHQGSASSPYATTPLLLASRDKFCENCHTNQTTMWRRGGPSGDQLLCNKCALYWARKKVHRPLTMPNTAPKRRRRRKTIFEEENAAGDSSSASASSLAMVNGNGSSQSDNSNTPVRRHNVSPPSQLALKSATQVAAHYPMAMGMSSAAMPPYYFQPSPHMPAAMTFPPPPPPPLPTQLFGQPGSCFGPSMSASSAFPNNIISPATVGPSSSVAAAAQSPHVMQQQSQPQPSLKNPGNCGESPKMGEIKLTLTMDQVSALSSILKTLQQSLAQVMSSSSSSQSQDADDDGKVAVQEPDLNQLQQSTEKQG